MTFHDLVLRLRALIFRSRAERDLDDELQFHLEMEARKRAAGGVNADAARREARLAFGGAEVVKEECRDARGTRWLEDFLQDVRYGIRMLRHDRGYTLTAVAALAVGIGANTSLFTVFSSVVLKPLPVPEPARLVSLSRATVRNQAGGFFSAADYLYYRDHNSAFTSVASETPAHLRLVASSGAAEPVMGLFVSANYLATFGVRPALGRDFLPEEERRPAAPYPALLSENYWRRRFGGDPSVIGKAIAFSGTPVIIIGITPLDFMGTRPDVPDVWVLSTALGPIERRALDRTNLSVGLTGKLRPGVTVQQAQAQLSALAETLRREYPEAERAWTVQCETAARFGRAHQNFIAMFAILQVAMALVLLIACSNVAGLLLGRAAMRQREIALRLSIGASRARLVRQFLTEGVLLAGIAGAAALLFSAEGLSLLSAWAAKLSLSEGGTIAIDSHPNLDVFLYILAISVFAGISFALVPALQSTRPDLVSGLKEEGAGLGVRRKSRLRGWMVTAQVAVCLALLIGGGLLSTTSVRLLAVDTGFETRHVLRMAIGSPLELGYSESAAEDLQHRIYERLRGMPGVLSVSATSRVPLDGNVTLTRVIAAGSSVGEERPFAYSYVSRDYFQTLGVPLLRGRTFSAQEIAAGAPVAVITDSLARRLWPHEDAVGKRIAVGSPTEVHFVGRRAPNSPSTEVIGVARDSYTVSLTAPDGGGLYLPKPANEWDGLVLIRTAGDPKALASVVLAEIRAAEARLPVDVETVKQVIESGNDSTAFRIAALVFGSIGLVGFVLAAIGVYSMASYSVSRQTKEVGIRMALGAQRRDVIRILLAGALRWIAMGLGIGATLGAVLSRLLASQFVLPAAQFVDPAVILAISLGTGGLALLAAYLPVRRATRMDPATTLRFE